MFVHMTGRTPHSWMTKFRYRYISTFPTLSCSVSQDLTSKATTRRLLFPTSSHNFCSYPYNSYRTLKHLTPQPDISVCFLHQTMSQIRFNEVPRKFDRIIYHVAGNLMGQHLAPTVVCQFYLLTNNYPEYEYQRMAEYLSLMYVEDNLGLTADDVQRMDKRLEDMCKSAPELCGDYIDWILDAWQESDASRSSFIAGVWQQFFGD